MMGTPDWVSDARVCENRAMDTLWTSSPKMGGFSLKASHLWRPFRS
jgi:hypothetical protein